VSSYHQQPVLDVRHWTETLFSFKTARPPELRFDSGQFIMVGLLVDDKPLMRAYSIASAIYDDCLEFLSIKVPDGPLTSRLKHVKAGDLILIGRKPVGTLVASDLRPGRHLYLFASGTGLAPFLSIIKDPYVYERFERVVLVHGVRWVNELAYRDFITTELPADEHIGEIVRQKLLYYPAVTREPFRNQGRITQLISSGRLFDDLCLPPLQAQDDRAMVCGSPAMLADLSELLNTRGLRVSPSLGVQGDYVIERAFAEK
jgi:ferredoxin/flavodoxin---NADP+ reductase